MTGVKEYLDVDVRALEDLVKEKTMLICTALVVTALGSSNPSVATSAGTVVGNQLHGSFEFLGIPYATSKRFQK